MSARVIFFFMENRERFEPDAVDAELGVSFEREKELVERAEELKAAGLERERRARESLAGFELPPVEPAPVVASAGERAKKFIEQNTPKYLAGKRETGTVAAKLMGLAARVEVGRADRERLPEKGPFLVIANHAGGETGPLLGLLKDYDAHVAAAAELNFNRSKFRNWMLKKLRFIPIKESLSNLDEGEKTALLERLPERARSGYRKVVERERSGELPGNADFLRTATAALLRGDVVAMFPEGLFLYDGKKSLRRAYGGTELVAKRVEQLSGEELQIVPIAIFKDPKTGRCRASVGEPVRLSEKPEKENGTVWLMHRLAEVMPEELRGEYGGKQE